MSYIAELSNGVLLECATLKKVYECAMREMRDYIQRSGLDQPYRAVDATIQREDDDDKLYGDLLVSIAVSTLSVYIRDLVTDRKVQYFRGELKEVETK